MWVVGIEYRLLIDTHVKVHSAKGELAIAYDVSTVWMEDRGVTD